MGGDSAVLIEIVIFAMIAAFLVHRLRSVLGRRTGEERPRPNPFAPPPEGTGVGAVGDNVIPLPQRNRPETAATTVPASTGDWDEPQSLAARLERVQQADPNFEEKSFLGGARAAFTMIVGAFAAGDLPGLRPLLADDVYRGFAQAVRGRQERGETLETNIVAIREADVVDARLDGAKALLTVRFITDQTNVIRDAQGGILDGDPAHPIEVIDVWTFARDTRSRDPNWLLVETRDPD